MVTSRILKEANVAFPNSVCSHSGYYHLVSYSSLCIYVCIMYVYMYACMYVLLCVCNVHKHKASGTPEIRVNDSFWPLPGSFAHVIYH